MCALPYDKVRIDLVFAGAWRSWSYRTQFPQVNTDLAKGLASVHVMTRADVDKQVFALYWTQEGTILHIRPRQHDWTPESTDDLDYALQMISSDVPLIGWQELAGQFLERFERKS
ncbi:hypothetical protein MUY14_07310 [Amycolatopsis sp. FBCC-B4732]|uniref:hypothetical protein n=1 Tax=Amycolatopsis sp. FBCC-B4732 TaxID=3079339 RepID=UPI001FF312E0|nr:hypothetical protein [Amycolatopsis sp. FBCC-B4732]UOX90423.1 hypothetical protein MUY14_07310 [Amycolatopsis sp. FBCC-B4732]